MQDQRTINPAVDTDVQPEPLVTQFSSDILEISVLGPLAVYRGGVDVTPSAQRERMVLALLALDDQRTVSVHRLLDSLWGQEPPPTARNSIQVAVSRLRQRIDDTTGPSLVVKTPAGYRLRSASLDADRFTRWHQDIQARHRWGDRDAGQLVTDVRVALGMWRDRTALVDLQGSIDVLVQARQLERRRLELVELLGVTLLREAPREAIDAVEHDAYHEWSRPLLQMTYLKSLLASGLAYEAGQWCNRLDRLYAADHVVMDDALRGLIERIRSNDMSE